MRLPFSAYASKRMVLALAGTGVTGMAGTGTSVGGDVSTEGVGVVGLADAPGAPGAPGADRDALPPGTAVLGGTGKLRVTIGRVRETLVAGRALGPRSSIRPDAAQAPTGTSTPTTIATTCHAR